MARWGPATLDNATRDRLERLLCILLALAACACVSYGGARLLFDFRSPVGDVANALDLRARWHETRDWFEGGDVYWAQGYQPASYLLLWPLVGWLSRAAARVLWAVCSAGGLVVLSACSLAALKPRTRRRWWIVALFPAAMYATGATLGNGQLGLHLLPLILSAVWLLDRPRPSLLRDLLAAALFLWTLLKVTVAGPFFWLLVWLPRRLRPALMVILGYLLCTVSSVWLRQGGSLFDLPHSHEAVFQVRDLQRLATKMAGLARISKPWADSGPRVDIAYGLGLLDLDSWSLVVSLALLAGLGLWVFLHRDRDRWALLGVSAVCARFFVYHRWYDDLLLLFPLLAVVRIATGRTATPAEAPLARWASVCGALLAGSVLLPYLVLPRALQWIYGCTQGLVWLAGGALLIAWCRLPAAVVVPTPTRPDRRLPPPPP